MNDITKHYSNEEITVAWKPTLCSHSTNCWKDLSEVFNPKERPWIKLDATNTEKIKNQIDKCPSGALSYTEKNQTTMEETKPNADCNVLVSPNGPLMIIGNIEIKHSDGRVENKEKTTAFCRCGASANKPFCDGSHRKIEFIG